MTDEQDDLTLVYMWAFKKGEESAKARIEALEAALRWYAENCAANGDKIEGPSGDYGQRARAALEGKIYGEDAEE